MSPNNKYEKLKQWRGNQYEKSLTSKLYCSDSFQKLIKTVTIRVGSAHISNGNALFDNILKKYVLTFSAQTPSLVSSSYRHSLPSYHFGKCVDCQGRDGNIGLLFNQQ